MSDPIVGIDLGTSNTVVACVDGAGAPQVLADANGYKVQPSVVAFHPGGSVLVGAEAKQRRVIDPRNTVYSVKRLIGRPFSAREVGVARQRAAFEIKEGANSQPVVVTRAGEFAVPEISAMVLDHARKLATTALGAEVRRAVVTVPANFLEAQRSATATAGAIAGLEIVRVLNEPVAAALAYGHRRPLDRTIVVYDFGGGTFDVSVMRVQDQVYEVLGTAGDSFLGGDDLDEQLVEHMVGSFLRLRGVDLRANELAMMRLRAVAEQTKIELSRRTRAVVRVDEIAYGAGGAALDLELELHRDEFVQQVAGLVGRTFPVCREALELAGLGIDDVSDVVLVGGTTRIPYVREQVERFFRKPPRTDLNPEEAVAAGAALQAAALAPAAASKRAVTLGPGRGLRASAFDDAEKTIPAVERAGSGPVSAPLPSTGSGPVVAPGSVPATRRTAPLGSAAQRGTTERPAAPGATVDRMTVAAGPATGARPLGRLTGAMPAVSLGGLGELGGAGARPSTARPATSDPGGESTAPPTPSPGRPGTASGFGDHGNQTHPGAAGPARTPAAAGLLDLDVEVAEPTVPGVPLPRVPAATAASGAAPTPSPTPAGAPTLMMQGGPAARSAPVAAPTPVAAPGAAPTLVMQGGPAARSATGAAPTPTPAPVAAPTLMMQGGPSGAARTTTLVGGMAAPAAAPPPAAQVLDVTPRALGIGTVGGFCEEVIPRNARIPVEVKRAYSTSRNDQRVVRLRVCLGESARLADNVLLGDLVLDGLEPRPRGETTIEVTYAIDLDGRLQVRARDSRSGREQRATLEVLGAQSPAEVEAARARLRGLTS